MKKILATTALVMLGGLPVLAQTATTEAPAEPLPTETAPAEVMPTEGAAGEAVVDAAPGSVYVPSMEGAIRASDLIGKRIYVAETVVADAVADADANWNDVGEVSDVVISLSGDIEAVLIDVGGFLGIGEKTVAMNLSGLTKVADSDNADAFFLVFPGTQAELESAPEFEDLALLTTDGMVADPAATDAAATDMAADTTATDPAMTEAAPTDPAVIDPAPTGATTDTAAAPADTGADIDWIPADLAGMTSEQFVGTAVFGPGDEHIGEVSDVVLGANDTIEQAIVDVGGFLGIGEKPVSIPVDMMTVETNAEGDAWRVVVNATQEQLEAMPNYQG